MPTARLPLILCLAALLLFPLLGLAPAAEAGDAWNAAAPAPASEPAGTERVRDLLLRLEHEMHALKHEIRSLRLRLERVGAKLAE